MKPKLFRLREAIKKGLVDAGVWDEPAVIIDRQSDFWNDVAVAMNAATHGAILIIGVARGDGTEEEGLESDLTIAITILARDIIEPDMIPEEQLWQDTVEHLHNAVPVYEGCAEHWDYRLRFQGFTDAPELVEGRSEVFQRARQTTFKVRFSLDPNQ